MLNIETARKIGINACIDRLGRDFVMARKEFASSAYGQSDDGVYCFVGVDDPHDAKNYDGALTLDSCSVFPYRASCTVDLTDGAVHSMMCVGQTQ